MTQHIRRRLVAGLAATALVLGAASALDTRAAAPAAAAGLTVTVPGSHGVALGCPGDWEPGCLAGSLAERADGVYAATFDIPAGDYAFKVAIGGSWSENYGRGGEAGGADIAYTAPGGPITFFYDPVTHYATTTAMGPVVSLAGSFQQQLGCRGPWADDCLAAWMQDPDEDGVYTFATRALATGGYEVKVVHGLSWSENYGAGGVAGGANIPFSVSAGDLVSFRYSLADHLLTVETTDTPPAGIGTQQAQWIDTRTIAVPADLAPSASTWTLHGSDNAGIALDSGEVVGGQRIDLGAPGALTAAQLEQRPDLSGYHALRVDLPRDRLEELLQGQLKVSAAESNGAVSAFTGVQIPGVLDDAYAREASASTLGASWSQGAPTVRLWAPTAQRVWLSRWEPGAAVASVEPASRDSAGVWTVSGDDGWAGSEYLWSLEVYAPTTDRIERNQVTDPYSVALTTGSSRSVLVDLDDPATRPALWRDSAAPELASPTSRTIYELSVRDFSATDPTVPEQLRGTYGAFAFDGAGARHLRELAEAGLNTVHLQPTFDFSSVIEDRSARTEPSCDLASYGPASTEQQACIAATAERDSFNWGYDPLHFLAPEGSYAADPSGAARVAEFRTMVGALHADGLQVVLDQVFNHTSGSGQAANSVLDRVVPGYYQRLDREGAVYTSTCCQNVATEHAMTEKLMVDTVVLWARQYRVDGFRFDLMGFNSVSDLAAMRAALDELTLEADGVDGAAVALYGEGWDFGEVSGNALFTQAIQGQLGGTGVGTFNDRLRDAVRGGSPVDGSTVQKQGYGSGLGTASNGLPVNGDETAGLGHAEDLIKIGLAGNLRDFRFMTSDGVVKAGSELDYNGSEAGYADEPDETVNYVDAHDNQTLYDALALKLPRSTSMSDRVRMHVLSLATATLSQSPSMWLAGTDLLRSKSLDNNSYDSGDWFNAIDWTGADNAFGRGLPPARDNAEQWDIDREILADPTLRPSADDIASASAQSRALLTLKASSPLFSLGSAAAIDEKLDFPAAQTPGTILMAIDDTLGADADPERAGALVVFNAGTADVTERVPAFAGRDFALSDVQSAGADPVVTGTRWDADTGTVTVPARTVAVLFEPEATAGLPAPEEGLRPPAVEELPPASLAATSDGRTPASLAQTGAEPLGLWAIAFGLLVAGVVVRAVRRRASIRS
jgi:pullulanase